MTYMWLYFMLGRYLPFTRSLLKLYPASKLIKNYLTLAITVPEKKTVWANGTLTLGKAEIALDADGMLSLLLDMELGLLLYSNSLLSIVLNVGSN